MIVRLVWSDGVVAILDESLRWVVQPEDDVFREAVQDLFEKSAEVAAVMKSNATEAGIRAVINTYRPHQVERSAAVY